MNIMIANEAEMIQFGHILGQHARIKDLIALTGDLGAGKTTLSKSIAKAMGITEDITSPTFTIVNEYHDPVTLYHFDVYRINDADEMYEIGYEEYFYGNGICLVEWANLIETLMPEHTLWLTIELTENPDQRRITVKGTSRWKEALIEGLQSANIQFEESGL